MSRRKKKGRWRVFEHNWGRKYKTSEFRLHGHLGKCKTSLWLNFWVCSGQKRTLCVASYVWLAAWRHWFAGGPKEKKKKKNGAAIFRRRPAFNISEACHLHVCALSVRMSLEFLCQPNGELSRGSGQNEEHIWLWFSSLEVKTDELHHVLPPLCRWVIGLDKIIWVEVIWTFRMLSISIFISHVIFFFFLKKKPQNIVHYFFLFIQSGCFLLQAAWNR